MNSSLRFGVIGYGLRGGLCHHAHRPNDDMRVVALADLDATKAAALTKALGGDVTHFTDHRAMLVAGNLDAVFVLSPDYLHEAHAIDCLAAGLHVYLEKPMATTLAAADAILAAAGKSTGRLYVAHNLRHCAFVQLFKRLLDAGAIGKLQTVWARHFISNGGDAYFKDWHADRTKSGSLLLQKATNDLDVLQWLGGGRGIRVNALGRLGVYNVVPKRSRDGDADEPCVTRLHDASWPPANATRLNPVIDVEDLSLLNAQLSNGVLIAYQQCHYTPDQQRNYTFIGDAGRMENLTRDDGVPVIRVWNRRRDRSAAWDAEHVIFKSSDTGHDGADAAVMDDFLSLLRYGTPPMCSPIEARDAVAIAWGATQSLRAGGQVIELPPAQSAQVDSRVAGSRV